MPNVPGASFFEVENGGFMQRLGGVGVGLSWLKGEKVQNWHGWKIGTK